MGTFRAPRGRLRHLYEPLETRGDFVVLGSKCGKTNHTWKAYKPWSDKYTDATSAQEVKGITCPTCLKRQSS